MKILVPVKQVGLLYPEFELKPDTLEVASDWLDYELNEWDAFSLEAALEIRDAGSEVDILVATVGGEEAEDGLLTCLAKGADRAIRIDPGSGQTPDVLRVARLLSAIVEREEPDLVLCGVQSSDAVNGTTGIALAGYAGYSHVAVVSALELENSVLTVERELEGGLRERLQLGLPALLTIQTGINEPRYANLRAIKMARKKPLEVFMADELGADKDREQLAAETRVVKLAVPSNEARAEMIDGDAAAIASRIVEIIEEVGVAK